MTELANNSAYSPATQERLDNLAMQAKMCVQNAAMNLLQLGRVLTEAKPLVPHGEWDAWIKTNAKVSRRTAEQYMQAYAEFGLNAVIAELGTTKVLKLLPMPQEERDKLLSENDVSTMSTRQLDDAIRKQRAQLDREIRAEVQGEIDRERKARIAAEKRAEEAESRPHEVPQSVKDLLQSDYEEIRKQQEEISRLKSEIRERDELLEEQQADYDKTQAELLDLKSTIAKGDAERAPADQLTLDIFASAVRSFIGTCARMPHMGATFSGMNQSELSEYDELLRTVESWTSGSRSALDTIFVDGVVIDDE